MHSAIELKDFSYTYPDGTIGLSRITLKIEPGQRVALIGPNGAGKSTLLLAMGIFLKATGTVLINGIEPTGRNIKKIRKVLGCCLQNPDDQLFMPRLFDDVAFGPLNLGLNAEEVTRRSEQALKTVGLNGMADKMPHHLSAGQKRAAAIATVLSMEPEIITLDEPDSSLDPRSRGNLLKLLRQLTQTLVIATCNMDFAAELCSRAILLDQGRIIAAGTAEEIMSNPKLMADHGLELPHRFR